MLQIMQHSHLFLLSVLKVNLGSTIILPIHTLTMKRYLVHWKYVQMVYTNKCVAVMQQMLMQQLLLKQLVMILDILVRYDYCNCILLILTSIDGSSYSLSYPSSTIIDYANCPQQLSSLYQCNFSTTDNGSCVDTNSFNSIQITCRRGSRFDIMV